MYYLIVDCSGFPLEHSVYLVDEGGQTQSIMQLPTSEIAGYANSTGVNKVYLQGAEDYCFGLSEEIAKQLSLEYSNNNIEIEVL